MAKWRKRPYLYVFWDKSGPYLVRGTRVGTRTTLSNGQILDLEFFRSQHTPEEIQVSIAVRKRLRYTSYRKEGTPIGPGGTEVWGVLSTLFPEGEIEAVPRLTLPATREIVVRAASDSLFRIYATYLKRRGYLVHGDEIWRPIS